MPLKKELIDDAESLLTTILSEIEKGWPRPTSTLPSAGAEFTFGTVSNLASRLI